MASELNFPKIHGAMNSTFMETTTNMKDSLMQASTAQTQNQLQSKFDETAIQQLQVRDQLPVMMNQNCLSCQSSGKDTQLTIRLFKLACLSYKSSEVTYRNQKMTRENFIACRRDLIDKMTATLPNSTLFKENAMYPRRYFDDLVLEQRIAEQQATNQFENAFKGTTDASKVF